ncbi:MAG: hypothetical protein HZC36_00420 [Armatimonadetes bacterium]|nr:hypothetical protein [Armatimonadota bacterium]
MNLKPPKTNPAKRNTPGLFSRLSSVQVTSKKFDDFLSVSGCLLYCLGALGLFLIAQQTGNGSRYSGHSQNSTQLLGFIEYTVLATWGLASLYGLVAGKVWTSRAIGCLFASGLATAVLPATFEPWVVFALSIGFLLYPRIRDLRGADTGADKSAGRKR